jgi:hypothetical protein
MPKTHAVPDSETLQRKSAVQIIDKKAIILGSLVQMVHTCGKKNCHCADGLKHVSLYLAVRRNRKRVMIGIPRSLEVEVREAVDAYKQLSALLESLSAKAVNRIVEKKKRGA